MKNKIAWLVLVLVFIATGLNFLDRQVLSMTIIKIQEEFHITDVQYGWINTSFLVSYALMFTIGGRIIDTVGGKIGLGLAVLIWSIACFLHGVMQNFYQLIAFRFLLGFGEGGCFPGAAKVVYEWFDEKKRGMANGIAIGGSAIGAVLAPPLTIYVASSFGWRASFIIPAIVGMIWVVGWFLIPWKRYIGTQREKIVSPSVSFASILKNKYLWVFVSIRFLLDPVLYFLMFWVPKYLSEYRGMSFERIGDLFWIPFLALGISNIFGGWISDKLIQRGVSINKARKWVMGIAAGLTLCAPFIAFVGSYQFAIALLTLLLFAHGFWITNYITAISDIFGSKATSTVVGLSGTAGALSSLLINPFIGEIVTRYSYTPLWVTAGLMYPLGFLLFLVFLPRIKALF
ncbi:ACS family hexuronate transporter-like MFS transporter [Sphingobacterium allocomposti]|uniref:ACS family hexuronate transporter-like MFS transporter n=1 Tax=Sphingobacterium allocomposti TaxID=415956 RepID=A0A5S5DPL7_9SPHI|nr:MFS transporter [Sphingobacterium composti Yoo et al. 2007 non Ten et al. 2007]TYP96639.1 ACS family hexuronate transporter-like MFS transporter [Sphingobacterium composti Yoo et al. 2007 non Ten et al. 2007]